MNVFRSILINSFVHSGKENLNEKLILVITGRCECVYNTWNQTLNAVFNQTETSYCYINHG